MCHAFGAEALEPSPKLHSHFETSFSVSVDASSKCTCRPSSGPRGVYAKAAAAAGGGGAPGGGGGVLAVHLPALVGIPRRVREGGRRRVVQRAVRKHGIAARLSGVCRDR